ncbi:uncharacterized protein LOC122300560 [Carya illinoinensis]|uniref:XS domain-containing protein n=1 Tax=Carya illinoinensis TaxID=32201 RepID=A0A8T1RD59_CARIL|nr:uncharacterized protein LOC122300560 [Carya illinoinensis]KAG6664504.1 hypothetical protein CIPAW_02G097300 [Carya illinoinensis]
MAGGNHNKSASHGHKKPSSSSGSSPQPKYRWESDKPPSDSTKKSGAPKHGKTPSNPSPKPAPTPSPAHHKPTTNPTPHSAPGPIPSPGASFPFPDPTALGPPPLPAYDFHMLERRTIVLADGSVRSYFALPLDYHDFTPPRPHIDPAGRFLPMGRGPELGGFDKRFPPPASPRGFSRHRDYWNSLGLDGRGAAEGSMKRKYSKEDEKDEFAQHGHPNRLPFGSASDRGESWAGTSDSFDRGDEYRAFKYMKVGVGDNVGLKHLEVDQNALKAVFLQLAKLVNENASQRKNYLEEGKHGRLQCIACGRSSKDYEDMHGLIMHAYNSDSADLLLDHLGLHKALCVLMGWNYSKPPDSSKAYQFLSADEAIANKDDLIVWPPLVIIHNTITGKAKDGRMEGLGNKTMDNKIRDLGFGGGKSKSVYGKDGHLGITLVKFSGDQLGLKEAMQLAEFFEKENHGRNAWARVKPLTFGRDDEKNPNLMRVDEKTQEKARIFYGYLGTASDLDKVDPETRKKVTIKSRREYLSK